MRIVHLYSNRPRPLLGSLQLSLWRRTLAAQMNTFLLAGVMKPESTVALAFNRQMQRVIFFTVVELLGFFINFICMILMRFGL